MGKKFIPNGDQDFAVMARTFARVVAREPARFKIAQGDADELAAGVERYETALQKSRRGQRSPVATAAKDVARAEAERIIRRLGTLVRANPQLDAVTKMMLGINERSTRPKILSCPQQPPRLRFVRALHEGNGATPMHELSFCSWNGSKVKPAGAVRLELFADLIPPEEKAPLYPGQNHGGRPWYLRSFTRSPIKLVPPLATVPMLVLYWGRWADSLGNVGPFSATAVSWVEGGSHVRKLAALPDSKLPPLLDRVAASEANGPAGRDAGYLVAVVNAVYASFHPQEMPHALPMSEEREQKQLEGPPVSEAA